MRERWRKALSAAIVWLCILAVVLALLPLAFVLFYVVQQGISSLNWAFFTHMPVPHGELGGGMANAIVGSLMVTGMGALAAIPIGIVAGVYAAEYRGTALANATRFAADTLNGVPSIVIGVFAYGIVVLPFHRYSAFAGRRRNCCCSSLHHCAKVRWRWERRVPAPSSRSSCRPRSRAF